MRDPVLQLDQLALQPKQLLEIDVPVERLPFGMLGRLGQQLAQSVVVESISSSSSRLSAKSLSMRWRSESVPFFFAAVRVCLVDGLICVLAGGSVGAHKR
jgi:hypothetical protein